MHEIFHLTRAIFFRTHEISDLAHEIFFLVRAKAYGVAAGSREMWLEATRQRPFCSTTVSVN